MGLCLLEDGQSFHDLSCLQGTCCDCSMSDCLQLLECEQADSPPPLMLQYYGYTTRTDANGKEFKFLDLKVSTCLVIAGWTPSKTPTQLPPVCASR